jgi:hypothetical protein
VGQYRQQFAGSSPLFLKQFQGRLILGTEEANNETLRPLLDGLGNDIEVIRRGGHAGTGEC